MLSKQVSKTPPISSSYPQDDCLRKGWLSLTDRRRKWKLREVRSWPRQQVKQGQSLDVGQVCLRASSQPRAPKESRGRAAPILQVGSAQDVDA